MTELLWLDVAALTVSSGIAVLDIDVQVGRFKLGRPIFGAFVLVGLLGVYTEVVSTGRVPAPGWGVAAFALLYLPFLSHRFVDLEMTDRLARRQLERLLLESSFRELRQVPEEGVLRDGRRKYRWRCRAREEGGGLVVELNVHPSLWPVTVSRPHQAVIRNQEDLERVRDEIRRRRAQGEP